MDTPAPVDAEAIAQLLSCSREKVYRLAKAGDIPGFRVGAAWRFYPEKVLEHLQAPRDPWAQSPRSRSRRRVA